MPFVSQVICRETDMYVRPESRLVVTHVLRADLFLNYLLWSAANPRVAGICTQTSCYLWRQTPHKLSTLLPASSHPRLTLMVQALCKY